MKYICVDRGSSRCPCRLMDAGRCYTCTMVREGVCRCGEKEGWQGVCPYIEYIQQGGVTDRKRQTRSDFKQKLDVIRHKTFGQVHVITLKCRPPMVQACSPPGTFIMVDWEGFAVPLSVMDAQWIDGEEGSISVAIHPAGPKTKGLLEDLKKGKKTWAVEGPFYNGLLNLEQKQFHRPLEDKILVIARGMAAMPLVALRKRYLSWDQIQLYLDCHLLTEEFISDYLPGTPYRPIDLNLKEDLEEVKLLAAERTVEGQTEKTEKPAVVMLLVSPYFVKRLTEGIGPEDLGRVITPNHANMCCGRGICGACSETDGDGDTLRLCKCSKSVLE